MNYFIYGQPVHRREAIALWLRSKTYRMASPRTRDLIFFDAEKGVNDNGELNHLREAGITIEPDNEALTPPSAKGE